MRRRTLTTLSEKTEVVTQSRRQMTDSEEGRYPRPTRRARRARSRRVTV